MAYDHLADFDFDLPAQLIAQYPLPERSASRLLTVHIDNQQLYHQQFTDLISWLRAGDILVFNNTKVIPARLFGRKASGGKIECLIERILSAHEALAHLRFSKPPQAGSQIILAEAFTATVLGREGDLFHLQIAGNIPILALLEQYGSIPLPPYIQRQTDQLDAARYQTIYAEQAGAVAAPTAGLHFDNKMLATLRALGVELAYITLHIGAGTFQPVRVDVLDQHEMHSEYMHLSTETCDAILNCQKRKGRVFGVGTTVARCLESAVIQHGKLAPFSGYTRLFIRPGFQFQCLDALITNFHLPKSTLLMLVSAFGGYDLVKRAYQAAIEHNYRFFSYGDAMLLFKKAIW